MRRRTAAGPLLGREIGGYVLLSLIGEGATGAVYLARDQRLDRNVALKVLANDLADRPDVRARFLREAHMAAGLDHPHIVPVHDAGESGGALFLAMRYVEGSDLRAMLRRTGPLAPHRALALVTQLARALDAAHARGLVHRDVKPGNVLIGEDEHAYLADFGVSQPLDGAGSANGPQGTPAYLAPEQIEGGFADARTDVYGLGCLFYECLCGEPPFAHAGSELAVMWAHLEEEPPRPGAVRPELPRRLDAVIARALAKDPRERFATCQAFVDAARDALSEPDVVGLPPELSHPLPPLLGRADALARLTSAWEQARQSRGALLVVTGPRGSGKTRLAAELARRVHADGGSVRYASAVAAGNAVPAAVGAALEARAPALTVIDDADAAPPELWDAGGAVRDRPVVVVATVRDAAAVRLGPSVDQIEIGPLEPADIRRLVALYGEPVQAPIEGMARATGGLPGPLHEVAAEWARAQARSRIAASAARAESERVTLRDAEAALTEHVLQSQLARERARLYLPELTPGPRARGRCPFIGLASYGSADADLFFGREQLVAELIAALAGGGCLALVGPSGCGKSSLLHAGVLPALAGGVLEGSERWTQVVMRPGELVHGIPREAPAVVVIDQLEELFTGGFSDAQRSALVDTLLGAAADEHTIVVIAIRADFYGRCGEFPALARLLATHHVLVGPMAPDELRRAIELPAARAGLTVERELLERLLDDVSGAAGALPLLSTALVELCDAQRDGALTLAAYTAADGVQGAVARLAEAVYGGLDAPQRALCRAIMLRLATAEPGVGTVRRRASLTELELEPRDDARAVLAALTERRLVTVGEHGAEVAHEALLSEWPRLREWLEADAEGQAVLRQLAATAAAWEHGGRPADELYRGARLLATTDWTRAHRPQLNATERAFLDESQRAADRETRRIRRANRRLRGLLAGTALLLMAAMAGGAIALSQREQARWAEVSALAQRLGAQGLTEESLDRSLLLARQAVELKDIPETASNLLGALLKSPAALRVLPGTGKRLLDTAMSPGGTTLVVSDEQDAVVVIDPRTFRRIGPPLRFEHRPGRMDLAPDGRTLAVALVGRGGDELLLIELPSRRIRARRALLHGTYTGISFSPDGARLAIMEAPWARSANRVRVLDARSGRRTGPSATLPAGMGTVEFAGPERILATWSDFGAGGAWRVGVGRSAVLDARTLSAVRRFARGSEFAAVSPNGRLAAIAAGAGRGVAILDLESGAVRTLSGRHDGIGGLAFSGAGTLVTTGLDNAVTVWDLRRGEPAETLTGHAGAPGRPAITPDGRTAFTAGQDGMIIAWDVRGDRRLGRRFAVEPRLDVGPFVNSRPALSSDGRQFVVHTPGDRLSIRGTRDLAEQRAALPSPGGGSDVAYLQDGAIAFAGDGMLGVLDPASGAIRRRVRVGEADRSSSVLTVQPRGSRIAVATGGRIALFDPSATRQLVPPLEVDGVTALALSPDARRVAVVRADGNLSVWQFGRAQPVRRHIPVDPIAGRGVAYTPDGRLLATGDALGYVRLWDAQTLRPQGERVLAHAGLVTDLAFSPDGATLFTGGTDGVAALWSVPGLRQIGADLPVGGGTSVFGAITPDGRQLVAVADGGEGVVWPLNPAAWRRHACAVAGRRLTPREWDQLLPAEPYRPACR